MENNVIEECKECGDQTKKETTDTFDYYCESCGGEIHHQYVPEDVLEPGQS